MRSLRFPAERGPLWAVLLPLALLYALVTWARRRWYPRGARHRVSLPVLCVGNVHVGGSGKTPVVAALFDSFSSWHPVILSRGYGGSLSRSGAWVEGSRADGAAAYGDEPWMLFRRLGAPVRVGRDRVRSARAVRAERPETGLLILDDGFQHLALERDVDLVVIHGRHLPEEAFCLPLGELREPLSALSRATAFLLTGSEADGRRWESWLRARHPDRPVFRAEREVIGLFRDGEPATLEGPYGAFCGIAHPEGFLRDLEARYGAPAFFLPFADHHSYSPKDIEGLRGRWERLGKRAALVTTDKDWYKLRHLIGEAEGGLLSLRVRYRIPPDCLAFLEDRLS